MNPSVDLAGGFAKKVRAEDSWQETGAPLTKFVCREGPGSGALWYFSTGHRKPLRRHLQIGQHRLLGALTQVVLAYDYGGNETVIHMSDYSYYSPKTLEEALQFLDTVNNLKIISGGTELMPRIRSGIEKPSVLMDISEVKLNFLEIRGNVLKIGSATPVSVIEYSEEVKMLFPALAEAASEIGGIQTRHLGTVGGNICSGVSSADLIPPLLVYDARVRIKSLSAERMVPLREFFLASRQTVLTRTEMVTEIQLDIDVNKRGSAFGKIGRRKAMRLAVVNAAACLEVREGLLKKVALAMGTVAPVPLRLYNTENFLKGKEYAPRLVDDAVQVMQGDISPRDSLRASAQYRRELAAVLMKRILTYAWQRAEGR